MYYREDINFLRDNAKLASIEDLDKEIQKAPWERLFREIISELEVDHNLKIQADALVKLRHASYQFMTSIFSASSLIADHCDRVTLCPGDIQLLGKIMESLRTSMPHFFDG